MPNNIGLSYKVLGSFFDRDVVIRAVSKAKRQALSKAGSWVRQAARSSMRRVGKKARKNYHAVPGKPPRRHQGGLYRGIVFAYDARAESVVIGPLRFNMDGGNVPNVLEFGGDLVKHWRINRHGHLSRRARASSFKIVRQVWHYKAFPYMAPAAEKVAPDVPGLFANTLGG